MSTLRTNTITDAAGANSMPVADINQGRAKAWATINGTGTISIYDSFGISSIVDVGVGIVDVNLSPAMLNALYSIPGSVINSGVNYAYSSNLAVSTTKITTNTLNNATAALADCSYNSISVFGDQ